MARTVHSPDPRANPAPKRDSAASAARVGGATKRDSVGAPNAIRSGDPVDAAILLTARQIWPVKTAAHLAAVAGVSSRCAELWLAGTTQMGRDALQALLWSAHGHLFLAAVMTEAPAPPTWWLAHRREVEIAQARQAEIEARERRLRLEAGGAA